MPHELTCPRCRHVLQVPDDAREPSLTCPRCLNQIANPAIQVSTPAPSPSSSAILTVEAVEQPVVSTRTCPRCGREVQEDWRVCPHGSRPLHRPRPPRDSAQPGERTPSFRKVRSVDREVRGDTQGTFTGLIILGVMGVVGIGLLVVFGSFDMMRHSSDASMIVGIGIAVLVAIVLGGGAMIFFFKNQTVNVVSSAVAASLTMLTIGLVVIGLVVVACGVVFSGVVNAFQTCITCGNPPHK